MLFAIRESCLARKGSLLQGNGMLLCKLSSAQGLCSRLHVESRPYLVQELILSCLT